MPRTHAPILAAILGVGLVLVATRSPRGELRAAADPVPALAVRGSAPGVGSSVRAIEPAASEEGGAESAGSVEGIAPATPGPAIAPGAIVIESEDVLARFAIPGDRLALLPGTNAPSKARAAFAGAAERPAIVALVASWCAPCAAELPELLRLAEEADLRLVLVSLDEVAGPESLVAVMEDLFARSAAGSEELPRLELRADPDGRWTDATAPLLDGRGDPGALPQTLLLSGDGRLLALVQGQLGREVGERLRLHAAAARVEEVCR